DPGLADAVLLLGPGRPPQPALGVIALGAWAVLPLVLAEPLRNRPHPLDVVPVGEVRAEGAAAVVRAVGVDAAAPGPEDARPARGQPGQVAAEPLAGLGGVGELDPDPGDVEIRLRHVDHPMSS